MRRRNVGGIAWPAGLAVCDPLDWLVPGDDVTDPVTGLYRCWVRWTNAREAFLLDLGVSRDDATVDSVGAYPRRDGVVV